jgi:exopolysaccharide production protein ExoQ
LNYRPTVNTARGVPGASPQGSAAPGVRSGLWRTGRAELLATTMLVAQIVIMVVPQGLNYNASNSMPTEGDAISRFTWLFLLGGGTYLAIRNMARVRALLRVINPFLLGFVVLATLSVAWSADPGVTVRRLIRVYTILLVCISFAVSGWNPRRFQNVLRMLLAMILVPSAIFCYTSPDLAIHHAENHPELMNAWHGLTTGKNILGSLASLSTVLWVHGWLSKQVPPFVALLGAAFSAWLLLMSKSSTSLMATVFAVGFMLMLLRSPGSLRRYMPYLVGAFATLVLVYALAVLHIVPGMDAVLAPITMITGKDLTFTGRTDIWYVLGLHIKLRPWFGSGYGAYWVGPFPTSDSYIMLAMLYFYPTEGHNGYLDVINDLGYVGGVCLLGYFAHYLRQALALMRLDRYQGGLYLTLIFRGFLADMSESHWFSVLSVDFVIMSLATVALARSLIHCRLEQTARSRAVRPATGQSLFRTTPAAH